MVLLLTAFAGFMGSTSLKTVSTSYQSDIARQYHLTQLAETMAGDLLQVRRSEKDFMMRKDLKYSERVNKFLDLAKEKSTRITVLSEDQEIKGKAEEISVEVEAYRSRFESLVAAFTARGLDEKSGVYGAFRDAAHSMEKVLQDAGFNQGEVLYLTIRRHEKDYMLRGAEKYIGKADKAIAELANLVEGSDLGMMAKGTIFTELQKYERTFHTLVEKDKEIETLIPQVKAAADHAMTLSAEIDEAVQAERVNQEKVTLALVSRSEILLMAGNRVVYCAWGAFCFFSGQKHLRSAGKNRGNDSGDRLGRPAAPSGHG